MGAPPAYPAGGRPMAPAPAAGWMVRPNVQGPYHTSDPSPTAGMMVYHKSDYSLSQRQEGPRPKPSEGRGRRANPSGGVGGLPVHHPATWPGRYPAPDYDYAIPRLRVCSTHHRSGQIPCGARDTGFACRETRY